MLTSLQALLRLAVLQRLGVFICALATLLAAASTASALEPAQAKTRVWGFDFVEHNSAGLFRAASSGKHQGNCFARTEAASGSLLAARGVPNSVGAMARSAPRILQTGGNTISKSTANALSKAAGRDLAPREWGRALERLKGENQLSPKHHGSIAENGQYLDEAGEVIDNILDYLP